MVLRSRIPMALCALLAVQALGLLQPPAASAQQRAGEPEAVSPEAVMVDPNGPRPQRTDIAPRRAVESARSVDKVRRALADHPDAKLYMSVPLWGQHQSQYAVTWIDTDGEGTVVADVYVDRRTGEVVEAWTGVQAGAFLARGGKPSVGRSLNSPFIWLPLAVLFLVPFVDPRRPFRLVHLDLLVLLSFGISQLFFNKGEVNLSVPLVYPPLLYLLGRMLLAGMRPRVRSERLMPFVKENWMWVGLAALVAFRIGLNVIDSGVIDVGYASVVGADRIMHGQPLYVFNAIHGDTYGPFNYLAYVPFVALFPWDGTWTEVVPAHAAAIAWDLSTIAGLIVLGRRFRVGPAFAWAWAAYPFSLLALQTNSNDALISALLVWALVAITSPLTRGALIGLAAAAKFAPLGLAPLFLTAVPGERRQRAWPEFALALGAATVGLVYLLLPDGGWREFYDTTIGFQLGRWSPFSIWGLHSSLDWLQTVVTLLAIGLGLLVAFVPRRRETRQVAALSAAVLIGLLLSATHWFYLYLAWITPPILIAVLGAYRQPDPVPDPVSSEIAELQPARGNGRVQILVQSGIRG